MPDQWSQYAVSQSAPPPSTDQWAQYAEQPSGPNGGTAPTYADEAKLGAHLVSEGAKGFLSSLNPASVIKGLSDTFQHPMETLRSLDPDNLVRLLKKSSDEGLSPEELDGLAHGLGGLGAQALLTHAAPAAVEALPKAPAALGQAAGATATALKGAAQGIAEGHKGVNRLAVPVVAGVATAIPGVGHILGPTIEGLYDAYQAVKGAKGALAERSAQQALDAKLAETNAAIEAHRVANPPITPDPNYTSAPPVPVIKPLASDTVQQLRDQLQAKIAARTQQNAPRTPPSLGNSAPAIAGPIEPIRGPLPSGRVVGGPNNVPATPAAREFFERTKEGEYKAPEAIPSAETAEPAKELSAPEFENRAGVADRTAIVAKKNDLFKTVAEFDSPEGQTELQKLAQQQGISRAKDGGYKKFSPATLEGIRARLFPEASADPIIEKPSSDVDIDYSNLLKESIARLRKK